MQGICEFFRSILDREQKELDELKRDLAEGRFGRGRQGLRAFHSTAKGCLTRYPPFWERDVVALGTKKRSPRCSSLRMGPCSCRKPNNIARTRTSVNGERAIRMTLALRRNSSIRPATGGTWLAWSRALPTTEIPPRKRYERPRETRDLPELNYRSANVIYRYPQLGLNVQGFVAEKIGENQFV
jgi:hypothetical protein